MQQEQLLAALVEAAAAYIYIKDEDGRFTYLNPAGAKALGIDPADCIGKTAYDVVSKDDADRTSEMDNGVRESGEPVTFKSVVDLPAGHLEIIEHKFPLPAAGTGAIGGITTVVSVDS